MHSACKMAARNAQIVDADGNFRYVEVARFRGSWCLRTPFRFRTVAMDDVLNGGDVKKKGFDYSVVTVLGCQSSGKSEQLHCLFLCLNSMATSPCGLSRLYCNNSRSSSFYVCAIGNGRNNEHC